MNDGALNYAQRAILQAAETRRLKLAKLARIQAAVKAAQAPDYFTYQTGRQRRDHARRAVIR